MKSVRESTMDIDMNYSSNVKGSLVVVVVTTWFSNLKCVS